MKTTNIIEIRRSIKDYSFNEEIARYKALNAFINSDINVLDLTNSDFSMLISDIDKLDFITESVCWKSSKQEITELLREANQISDYWFHKLNQNRGLKIELWKARINQIQHLDDIEADINKGIYKIFSLTDKSLYENVFEDDFDIELAICFTSTASDLGGIVWNGRQKVAFVQNGIASYFEITKAKNKSNEMPFQTWQQQFSIMAEAYQNKFKLAA
jgi:hypothetical protein